MLKLWWESSRWESFRAKKVLHKNTYDSMSSSSLSVLFGILTASPWFVWNMLKGDNKYLVHSHAYLGDDADVALDVSLAAARRVVRVSQHSPLVIKLTFWEKHKWIGWGIQEVCWCSPGCCITVAMSSLKEANTLPDRRNCLCITL